jgi:hypothetical protein
MFGQVSSTAGARALSCCWAAEEVSVIGMLFSWGDGEKSMPGRLGNEAVDS